MARAAKSSRSKRMAGTRLVYVMSPTFLADTCATKNEKKEESLARAFSCLAPYVCVRVVCATLSRKRRRNGRPCVHVGQPGLYIYIWTRYIKMYSIRIKVVRWLMGT